jgi:lipoprotein-anchoring transpeptidase ErfK/SrfK
MARKVRRGFVPMTLRLWFAMLAVLGVSAPASADEFSPWGVWSDGAQLKKSKSKASSFVPPLGASNLGIVPPPSATLDQMKPKFPAKPVEVALGGDRPEVAPKTPATVPLDVDYAPGEVIIDTSDRVLYYMISSKLAYAYPIAVGKVGFAWTGTETVSKIVDWPDWLPPDEMRQRKPSLPIKMTGGVNNPLGAKAIYLGNTLYRIHGTNDGNSIGTAASSGCFRMHNAHVVHLASLVDAGTKVHVLKGLPKGARVQII